eukprot:TRINITY_DN3930_c0_g1_i1.p1 TRINITY_DN3930_c0_g1~~TRINITY_DN3930_c0_g1_i1.p1  ORF type:complete len:632 (+),score=175.81 TRINITY_DN3930_c0_g1_i1:80-1975(+)
MAGELARVCPQCGAGDTFVHAPDQSGADTLVCEACGFVNEEQNLRIEVELDDSSGHCKPVGVAVSSEGTVLSKPSVNAPANLKHIACGNTSLSEAHDQVSKVAGRLRLGHNCMDEMRNLAKQLHEKKVWRSGRTGELMAAALAYIVSRRNNKSLTLLDVADCAQEKIFSMGRHYRRVAELLGVHVEIADPALYVERAVSQLTIIKDQQRETIVNQASRLVNLAKDQWIATGRKPAVITGAAIVIALEANSLPFSETVKEVSDVLHISTQTTRLRYREMKAQLLNLAKTMPWGNDVNRNNLNTHLPFILQNLEFVQAINPYTRADKSAGPAPPAYTKHENDRRRRQLRLDSAKRRLSALLHPTPPPETPATPYAAPAVTVGSPLTHTVTNTAVATEITPPEDAAADAIVQTPASPLPTLFAAIATDTPTVVAAPAPAPTLTPTLTPTPTPSSTPSPMLMPPPPPPEDDLTAEDLVIEKLLLEGYSDEQILSGQYRALTDSMPSSSSTTMNADGEVDIDDDEIDAMLRTPDEVSLMQLVEEPEPPKTATSSSDSSTSRKRRSGGKAKVERPPKKQRVDLNKLAEVRQSLLTNLKGPSVAAEPDTPSRRSSYFDDDEEEYGEEDAAVEYDEADE